MATRASLTASRPIEATEGVLEVPPLPVTPPVTPGRAEIPSLICAVR